MNQKKMGTFLKNLRKEKNMTQEQLAEYLNVSGRTVSRWETGSNMPDIDILIRLSDYYEIDIRNLLDGERNDNIMNTGQKETLQKVADYNSYKEKILIKKIHSIVISGIIAWGVSFMLMIRFVSEVRGVEYLLVGALFSILIYSAGTFSIKVNRTTSGYMTSLIGAFIAISVSNILLFILFFGTGTYHNYGLVGFYYFLIIFVLVFFTAGVITTVLNKKREKEATG